MHEEYDYRVDRKLLEKLLDLPSAFLIGSRGLGVADEYSDYDIVIYEGDLPEDLTAFREVDVKDYFQILPLGNTRLLKAERIDLLVYDNVEHLNVVRNAMWDLKKVPQYLLKIKGIRIDLYREALAHHGPDWTRF